MTDYRWVKEFAGAVIVCDKEGTILELNESALAFNADKGGAQLIGKNAIDCHSAVSKEEACEMLEAGRAHMGLIELEDGKMLLTYYAPWYLNGEYQGLVELVLEVPSQDSHLIRRPAGK